MNWIVGIISVPLLFAIFKRLFWIIIFTSFKKKIAANRGEWLIYSSLFITGFSALLSIIGIKYLFMWLNLDYSIPLLVLSSASAILLLTYRLLFQSSDKEVVFSNWKPDPNASDEQNVNLREQIETSTKKMNFVVGIIGFLIPIFT